LLKAFFLLKNGSGVFGFFIGKWIFNTLDH
jgi:hypothetical protein